MKLRSELVRGHIHAPKLRRIKCQAGTEKPTPFAVSYSFFYEILSLWNF